MNNEIHKKLSDIKNEAKGYSVSRIKLVSGEIIKGVIEKVNDTTVVVKLSGKDAKSPLITIPGPSILYISDSNLLE
jgi:hypothetical protein